MKEKKYLEDEMTKEELLLLIKRIFPIRYNTKSKEYSIIFMGFQDMLPKDINTLHRLYDKEKGK